MDDEKEGDIRVPLIFSIFCLCVLTGGVFLVFYVFVPSLSQPWYPVAALVLIGSPWLFWLLTYIYTCIKGCCRRGDAAVSHQISRRQTTRNASSAAMQNHNGSRRQQGGADSSVASSREPEMPLTYSV